MQRYLSFIFAFNVYGLPMLSARCAKCIFFENPFINIFILCPTILAGHYV